MQATVAKIPIKEPADLLVLRHRLRVSLASTPLSSLRRIRVATAFSELGREMLNSGGGEVVLESDGLRLSIRLSRGSLDSVRALLPGEVELEEHGVNLPVRAGEVAVDPASRLHGLQIRERQLHHARETAREALHALETKSVRLQRANADLEMVAAAAAHDLKEPLQVIRLFAAGLARREDAKAPATRIREGADRMSEMLDGLMGLLRVDAGDRDVATPVGEVFDDVLADLQVAIRQAGGHVERAGDGEVAVARSHLRAILQNLIANAMKYRRKEVAPVVTVATVARGNTVEVSVTDNGRGIPERDRQAVFVLFRRLQRDRQDAGTGVGLAFVARVVAAYDGTVRVEEGPNNEGSRFVLTLPIARPTE